LRSQFKLHNPSKEQKQAALSSEPPMLTRDHTLVGAHEPIPDVPDSIHLSEDDQMFEEGWDEQELWDSMQQHVPDAVIRVASPEPPPLDNLDFLRLCNSSFPKSIFSEALTHPR
jgi:hypothetical protein